MSRTPISAANWKMHLTDAAADALCAALADLPGVPGVEVVIAPGFLQLARVRERLPGVGVAGQTMHQAEQGAFTGEVSPGQLRERADWVILGHSERRQYFCETDAALQAKVQAALAHGLRPILCVGERREQRDAGEMAAVLATQVRGALSGIDLPPGFVIAYEPVWAIGTGLAADGATAQEAAALIRRLVAEVAGAEVAASVRILYGGSVKPDNVAEYAGQPDVDGALVGGASLDAAQFLAITRAIAGSA